MRVTLIIPLKNEESSVEQLIQSIYGQTIQPSHVILVDGGSTDRTVPLLQRMIEGNKDYRIVETGGAMPGKGRNIGAALAETEWIAFTDAGTGLKPQWLELLIKKAEIDPSVDIIYGNYSPYINSFFEKCATFAYVPAQKPGRIRAKSIVSCLLKRNVWEAVGGFPDWRAAEDLDFIKRVELGRFKTAFEPGANVHWHLQPDFRSTYRKFELYSKHNVWAGMQAMWHYGIAKQYILLLAFIAAGILFNWYWFLLIPLWFLARAQKRIFSHKHEFGIRNVIDPAVVVMVGLITVVIDIATFSGWVKAVSGGKIVNAPDSDSRLTKRAG